MFYLKRALMKKIVNGKKKKQPFDFKKSEAFTVATDGDGTYNNSYYFSAHSAEKQQSFYTRLGLRNDGSAEVWVAFFQDGQAYVLKDNFSTAEKSPLSVTRTEGGWSFAFKGVLTDLQGKEHQAALTGEYTANGEPVDFFYHMPTVRVATAMAQDKWTKDYFAGIQQNNSVHYEQEGVLKGELLLDGTAIPIDLPCLRDHSYGRRVWGYMNNHVWLAAVDSDCMFNFSMVSYPAMSVLEVGHLREKNSPVEYVVKANYDRNQIVTGTVPQTLTLQLKTSAGRTIKVTAELLYHNDYVFEGGAYTLTEGIANFTVNGISCRGILEVGFNGDETRFMNGKKLEKIRN